MIKKYWPVVITSLYIFLSLLWIHEQRQALIKQETENSFLKRKVESLEKTNIRNMQFISQQIIARLDSLKLFHK